MAFQPKNLRFFVWGVISFLVFLTLLFLETKSIFFRFDPAVTVWFQGVISRTFDTGLSFFSLLGNIELTSALVLAIGVFLFYRTKRIYFPLVLFFVITVFEFMGKFLLYHPGPPIEFFRFSLPFEIPHLYVKTVSSFPSGHVSRTMFLVVIGLFLVNKFIRNLNQRYLLFALLALISVLMIVSRIYLGEHWASDTIGGLFLGSSMGLLALVYY